MTNSLKREDSASSFGELLATTSAHEPELKEDIFVHEAKGVVQLVDNAGEDALLLRLLLVAGARRRVRHGDLGRLLGIGQAQARGQSHWRLRGGGEVFRHFLSRPNDY